MPDTRSQTLAYVYDRTATTNRVTVDIRLGVCAVVIGDRDWGGGGWFLDVGDDAISDDHRPAFETMLRAMKDTEDDQPRVCLVWDWDRLSRTEHVREAMIRRVHDIGGWVETSKGEKRMPSGMQVQVGRPGERMIGDCYRCRKRKVPVIVVGHIETGSGPGGSVHACLPCKQRYGILPLEEHPDYTSGSPIVTHPRGHR